MQFKPLDTLVLGRRLSLASLALRVAYRCHRIAAAAADRGLAGALAAGLARALAAAVSDQRRLTVKFTMLDELD
jgi:hypothetical protein